MSEQRALGGVAVRAVEDACRSGAAQRRSHVAGIAGVLRRAPAARRSQQPASVEQRITGDACVEALLRAGFRFRSRSAGIAILVRATSMVVVPDVHIIEADMLAAILRSAGMTWPELEKHLAHIPSRSGFFTKQPPAAPARLPGRRDEPADSTTRRRR